MAQLSAALQQRDDRLAALDDRLQVITHMHLPAGHACRSGIPFIFVVQAGMCPCGNALLRAPHLSMCQYSNMPTQQCAWLALLAHCPFSSPFVTWKPGPASAAGPDVQGHAELQHHPAGEAARGAHPQPNAPGGRQAAGGPGASWRTAAGILACSWMQRVLADGGTLPLSGPWPAATEPATRGPGAPSNPCAGTPKAKLHSTKRVHSPGVSKPRAIAIQSMVRVPAEHRRLAYLGVFTVES